jgi:tRNA(Ile)-lysidine synthase
MKPVRQSEGGIVYIRPLLDVHRAEIEAFLKSLDADWREDGTNQETEYSRNYMRHVILPQLSQLNNQAVEHINRSAEQLSELRDYMEQSKQQIRDHVIVEDGRGLCISKLLELHPVLQKELVLDAMAEAAGSRKDITAVHVKDVLDLCGKQSGKEVHLPYGVVARRDFDKLLLCVKDGKEKRLEPREDLPLCLEVSEKELEELALADGTEVLELEVGESGERLLIRVFSYHGENLKFLENPYTKWLDYDKIKQGFCIRTRQSGDYFIGDSEGHRKKLKQYFTEEKISVKERSNRWLLAQDSLVLWLVGGRISEHLKVTDQTKLVVEITYQGGTEDGF